MSGYFLFILTFLVPILLIPHSILIPFFQPKAECGSSILCCEPSNVSAGYIYKNIYSATPESEQLSHHAPVWHSEVIPICRSDGMEAQQLTCSSIWTYDIHTIYCRPKLVIIQYTSWVHYSIKTWHPINRYKHSCYCLQATQYNHRHSESHQRRVCQGSILWPQKACLEVTQILIRVI